MTDNHWWGGGVAEVSVKNNGTEAINGWSVSWTYLDNSRIDGFWNGVVTGSSPTFTATDNGDWNKVIYPGQTATVGMVVVGQNTPDPVSTPVVTGDVCK